MFYLAISASIEYVLSELRIGHTIQIRQATFGLEGFHTDPHSYYVGPTTRHTSESTRILCADEIRPASNKEACSVRCALCLSECFLSQAVHGFMISWLLSKMDRYFLKNLYCRDDSSLQANVSYTSAYRSSLVGNQKPQQPRQLERQQCQRPNGRTCCYQGASADQQQSLSWDKRGRRQKAGIVILDF